MNRWWALLILCNWVLIYVVGYSLGWAARDIDCQIERRIHDEGEGLE